MTERPAIRCANWSLLLCCELEVESVNALIPGPRSCSTTEAAFSSNLDIQVGVTDIETNDVHKLPLSVWQSTRAV